MRERGELTKEEEMPGEIGADCGIEDMLAEAAEGKAAQALSINDYLRQRLERLARCRPPVPVPA